MSLEEKRDGFLKETPEQTIKRLSNLSLIEYEEVRVAEAKKLNFRTGELDKFVTNARKETEQFDDEVVTDDEPYYKAVNGDELLQEITRLINKHMVLPKGALSAVSLWIMATYVYDAFRVFPKLAVISPEKRCGKSTLLDILSGLCCRGLLCSNISPAAIFRSIELWKPTLIIDEADTFLAGRNDEMTGIINSGHTRTTAKVMRLVGDEHTPKNFSTWSPMAFASIKGLTGTTMDRSITVQLRRRTVDEKVKRLSIDFKDDNALIRQKLARWAKDNFYQLKTNVIEPPEIPNDRAIDNWLPLFTIANALGGSWSDKVESAYFILESKDEEETAAVMLLQDIKAIFGDLQKDKIFSRDIVDKLVEMEERPWCEWKKGQPMTQNSLAKMLKTFGICSKKIRIVNESCRGFELSQFKDTFTRYISNNPIQSGTVEQGSDSKGYRDFQGGTKSNSVPPLKTLQPCIDVECSTVPLKKTLSMGATNDEGIF